MAKLGRRLLVVVALCIHINISSHDQETGNKLSVISASSQQGNSKSSLFNRTLARKNSTVIENLETEVYDVNFLEAHEAGSKKQVRTSSKNSTKTAAKFFFNSNDTDPESKTFSDQPFINTTSLFNDSSDLATPSSLLGDVLVAQTAKTDSLFQGNGTMPSVLPEPKSTDATPPAQPLYHIIVGENCTMSMFRSDMDTPVTDCSVSGLLKSNPWTNKLSQFGSLLLVNAHMEQCNLLRLKTYYILDGRLTFSTGDELFVTNETSVRYVLKCIRLHSPPATIIQLTVIHVDDSLKVNRKCFVRFYPGMSESIETLAKGRVLQSDSNEAVFMIYIDYKDGISPIQATLQLAFQAVAWCMKEQLEVQCPRENKTGYIQTPHWDGRTSYNSNMNTCMTITSPADHLIMLSFVALQIQACPRCFCDVLEIYLSQACKGPPVLAICSATDASPAAYQASVVSLRFKSNSDYQASGFRLLYSFHSRADPPRQLQSGKWQCSGAAGPILVQHFICSADTFCENAEDKVFGCLPEGLCGEISQQFDGKCYRYFRPQGEITWLYADRKCKENNGQLISLNTEGEWKEVADFWINVSDASYLLVGLRTAATFSPPELYYLMWMWSDKTRAFYLNINYSSEVSPPYCAMFPPNEKYLTITSCNTPISATFLCEFGSQLDHSKPTSQQSKILLPVPFRTASALPDMTGCPNNHATHVFLQCDEKSYCYEDKKEEIKRCLRENPLVAETMFTCRDGKQRVHYTVVCDAFYNCADKSDESSCTRVGCPFHYFKCRTQNKCILQRFLCDHKQTCPDGSDEDNCTILSESNTVPPPAVINFTGTGSITVSAVNSSHSDPVCPETHFQCPGDGYCLPVYVRCNKDFDCPGGDDEAGCASYTCPGFYRCVGAETCVHADHLCDGIFQCPRHDDEYMCNMTCPETCMCMGFAFTCKGRFSAHRFPQLRYLNADNTGMNLQDVTHNSRLIHLSLRHCNIKEIGPVNISNLQSLDLSYNALTSFTVLENMKHLRSLSLSFNELLSLNSIDFVNKEFRGIIFLDLSGSNTHEITETSFLNFPEVQHLNLSKSKLQKIQKPGFSALSKLKIVDLSECPVTEFYGHMFKGIPHLETIYASKFQMCCPTILPEHFCNENCFFPSDGISSCAALLRSHVFRVFLVLYAFFALVGNFYSFVYRVFGKGVSTKLGFDIFVTHLCVSDFLMGVYLAIVGIADRIYYGTYEWNDLQWKQSVACQSAGFLSFLSSEVSAFLICFITLERFLLIRFPHRNLRFTPKSAQAACVVGWMVGVLLAAIPLLPFSPAWEFYGQTGICIPLPITTKVFPGSEYSFYLMIVFNFILFLLIAAGQFLIFWSIRSQTKTVSSSSKKAKDMAIARRLLAVVMSDFLCWFPIGLLGLMAKSGIPVSGDVTVAMAIFVLPFNSALNPFLYTFHMLFEQRRIARAQYKTRGQTTQDKFPMCARSKQGPSCDTPSLNVGEQQVLSTTLNENTDADQETLDLIEIMMKKILEENLMRPTGLLFYLNNINNDRQSVGLADKTQT